MPSSSPFRRVRAAAAKGAFGALVFVTTIAAWSQLRPAVEARTPLPGAERPSGACTIWFVGSSSINRWRTLARDMAPWDARNRGVDGASITEVNERFAADGDAHAPLAIVFYIGENDIAGGASAADTARGIARLTGEARARWPGSRIFVIGMKPSPARWRFRPEQLRFDAIQRGTSAGAGYRFVDVGEVLLDRAVPGAYYAADGVHLNAAGYRRWGSAIRHAVERDLSAARRRACPPPRP